MKQIYDIIQRAFMEAHFRVKGSHALKNVHAAGVQSPKRVQGKRKRVKHIDPVMKVCSPILFLLLYW